MNHFSYPSIPSVKQFQKDSSILLGVRKEDTVLTHIDWLLERYEARNQPSTEPVRRAILSDLFMTCNFWIKSYHAGNGRTRKERYPAVLAVFESAVNALSAAEFLNCNRAKVPGILAEIYGHDMHLHGIQVDHDQERARYLSKLERQIYRLRFKGGIAFQYGWWRRKLFSSSLVLAESKRAYTALLKKGEDGQQVLSSEGFGCFIMTIEREIFMAKPDIGEAGEQNGIFHSSFTCGDIVTMAGSMLIEKGTILAIRGDSGHYKPTMMNMALLLQGLAMYGVDLNRIAIFNWDGMDMGGAEAFLRSKMSWPEFEKQRRLERLHRADADDQRRRRGLEVRFPNLARRGPALGPRPGQGDVFGAPVVVPQGGEVADNYNVA